VAGWDIRRAPAAFRYLSQARNIGKVVLTMPAPRRGGGGTTLVTGVRVPSAALVARHLATGSEAGRRGADNLLLLSRRGRAHRARPRLAAELAGLGTGVRLIAADVADHDQLAAVLAAVPAESPLRAVVHAAGVLDDGVLHAQTPARIEAVLRPKADGAWNLHRLTRHLDLDRFVLFSSVSGLWGNAGQAGYAAANTFLDALAAARRRAGPAGDVLGLGTLAGRRDVDRRRGGGHGLGPDRGGLAADGPSGSRSAHRRRRPQPAGRRRHPRQALLVPARLDLRAGGNPPALMSGLTAPVAGGRARRAVGSAPSGGRSGWAERLAGLSEVDRDEVVRDLVRATVRAGAGHARP